MVNHLKQFRLICIFIRKNVLYSFCDIYICIMYIYIKRERDIIKFCMSKLHLFSYLLTYLLHFAAKKRVLNSFVQIEDFIIFLKPYFLVWIYWFLWTKQEVDLIETILFSNLKMLHICFIIFTNPICLINFPNNLIPG